MTQDSATTTGKSDGRPFIVRLLINLFRLVFWAALIGGVVAGGLYLQSEIESLRAQLAAANGRVDLLRSDVDTYALGNVPRLESELSGLSATVTGATQDIEGLENVADEQAATLSTLSTQTSDLETTVSDLSETAAADATALRDEAAVLRADLTAAQDALTELQTVQGDTESDITALSAALGSLSGQTATLADDVTNIEESNADIFAVVRVWSLVSQARLSIATEAIPAAQAAIKSAQTAVTAILENSESDALVETMTAVKENLDEAAGALPTNDTAAGDSLETAWTTLDLAVSTSLGYADLEADIIGSEEETEEADNSNGDEEGSEEEDSEESEEEDEEDEDDNG